MQNGILSETINNAIIQIGDIDDTGKGRHFVSRFIKDGLVKIEGHGIVLLKKETLDASLPSMVGTPVIIQHQNVTKSNADKLRIGTISNAYFNEPDGWYYCEGIIWDDEAKDLIDKGWSVSCSYDFLAYNDEGGVENNIKYDKEFTQLNFTHLAIVNNPRYERANIVFNSKEEEKGQWITIKGNHIFIPDGKTLDEVIKEKNWGNKENKQSDTKDNKSDTEIKQSLGKAISEFYSDKVDISTKTLKELKELSGRDISKNEVIEIARQVTKDHDWDKAIERLKGSKEDRDADKFRENRAKERKNKFKNDKVKAFLNEEYEEGNIVADRNKMKKLANFLGVDFWDLDDDRIQDIFEYSGEDYQYFENHTDEENRDYDIERTADKLKEYAKELNQNKEGARQNLLKQDLKSMLKKISPSADYRYDADEKELQVRYLGKWEGDDGSGDYDWQTPTQDTKDKIEEIKKEFKKRFGYNLKSSWGEKNWYSFWIPDNKTNNSKEQDMALLEELKKLIFKVENEKENDEMIDNEKVDKRKLIDEVAGIMKSAGCDDEDIRTAIGKMEKIGYDKSEDGSADNKKVKNEEPEKKDDVDNKKVKNEDDDKKVDELKKEEKEDVDNKCKNSKSSFDKINEIYNSIKQVSEEKTYVSRQEKLDNAVEYFK